MKAEGVAYEDGVVEKLLHTSEGDLRRAITYLQSAHRLTSAMSSASTNGHASKRKSKVISDDDEDEEMSDAPSATGGTVVTVKIIEEIAGVIPPATIDELASAMQGKGLVYSSVARCVENIVMDGWSANQLLQVCWTHFPLLLPDGSLTMPQQLYAKLVIEDETISAPQKNKIVGVFSEMDKRLIDGSEEHLAILDLSLRISGILLGVKWSWQVEGITIGACSDGVQGSHAAAILRL
jgi:DNA polymerase III delta prime subunit